MSPRSTVLSRALAPALLVLSLSACSDGGAPDAGADKPAAEGDVRMIQPGKPGEEASTIGPEDVPAEAEWNHADVAFMQMMVPHHAQALEMSRLAPTRAASPAVKSLARRIEGAQGPEVLAMSGWLDARGLEVPKAGDDPMKYDHGEHGHTPMMGMLTDRQLAALKAARGATFDRLFLEGMIGHHQGAVDMADVVTVEGSDLQVSEIAADVSVGQQAEIARMQDLLTKV